MHEQQFTELYQHFYPPIYGYLLKKTQSHEQAEDLAQEVFVRMLAKFDGEHAATWLFRVANNLFIDFYRRQQKIPFLTLGGMDENFVVNIPDESPSPEEVATKREVQDRLAEFSQPRKRVISLLCQGYSNQEVAEQLGVSVSVIKSRWYRILCQLREEAQAA